MKIKFLIMIVMLCLSLWVNAKEWPTNEIPMYGGSHTPTVEQNKKFSESAAQLAWQYYYKGDLETAIKRFNQAWMFDRDSIDALWGFGLIMGRRASEELPEQNLKESIRFLGMAVEKAPRNARILVDLALSHTTFGQYLINNGDTGSRDEFLKAKRLYETAEKIDPNYPLLHFDWSVLEFYQGNYLKSQERLNQAKKLGFQPDPVFVQDLEGKLKK
jgi:tetratricopeptide (TPR) repeat protein